MDFKFFEKLSKREANTFLQEFLKAESSKIKTTVKTCVAEGLKMDYRIKSISPFLRWVLKKLKTTPLEPDPAVPEWLRSHEVYIKNLFDFDEGSGILIVRAGYYLGESFVRSYRNLRWSTGDVETAEANMPVVTGFQFQLEMAPVLVTDNLLARIISNPKKIGDIEKAIESWKGDV